MKATIDIPDELFRRTKASAALQGRSLRDLVAEALTEKLERLSRRARDQPGWRGVFGRADLGAVEEIDAIVAAELGVVEPDAWQ